MDLDLQNPYDVIEESELDYSFCTRDGITYRAYFLSASHLHDSFTDAYSFSIEPIGESEDINVDVIRFFGQSPQQLVFTALFAVLIENLFGFLDRGMVRMTQLN